MAVYGPRRCRNHLRGRSVALRIRTLHIEGRPFRAVQDRGARGQGGRGQRCAHLACGGPELQRGDSYWVLAVEVRVAR